MKLNKQHIEKNKKLHDDVKENWPFKRGKNEFLAFLRGEEVHRAGTCLAMCYQCMVGYDGGPEDCQGFSCPLYPYYPYRTEKSRKEYTPEQKEAMAERIKKMHDARKAKENEKEP